MFNKIPIQKTRTLYFFLLLLPTLYSKSSTHICETINTSPNLKQLYDEDHAKKSAALTKEYGTEIDKYLNYPTQFTVNNKPLPASKIHTIISGGNKPFSLITKANHQAYAKARGIQYRYVIPEEYTKDLESKRRYWLKVFALRDLLHCEHIPENSWVMWIDDDIVINDFNDNIPMPDQYINFLSKGYQLLVTDDIVDVRLNTGIVLIKKNDITRLFLHTWEMYSFHPVHGYESQGKTLHEQEVLRNLIGFDGSMFSTLNSELRLIKILPSRREDLNMNLNTFKRENFVMQQDWTKEKLHQFNDGEKQWREGDSFVHCGAGDFKPKIIMHTLDQLFSTFSKETPPDFWSCETWF